VRLQAARLSGLDKQYTSDLKDMLGAAARCAWLVWSQPDQPPSR
jgi:hypothetical protein